MKQTLHHLIACVLAGLLGCDEPVASPDAVVEEPPPEEVPGTTSRPRVECDETPRPFSVSRYMYSRSYHVDEPDHAQRFIVSDDALEGCSGGGIPPQECDVSRYHQWHHVWVRYEWEARCVPTPFAMSSDMGLSGDNIVPCQVRATVPEAINTKEYYSKATGGHKHSGNWYYGGCTWEPKAGGTSAAGVLRRRFCRLTGDEGIQHLPGYDAILGDAVALAIGHGTAHSDNDADAATYSAGLGVSGGPIGAFAFVNPALGGEGTLSNSTAYIQRLKCVVRDGRAVPVCADPEPIVSQARSGGRLVSVLELDRTKWPASYRDDVNRGCQPQ